MNHEQVNLSDFTLFLAVMKNKKAYQNTLSIILDEPDIQLIQVKVEEVVLNEFGQRAIRLDAWARSNDDRVFNMEMQNEAHQDSLPKRSRYYQSLLDAPLLKSGKTTKYRHLPATTIIFITQDDIFGKDLAKYTFTEQCEEIAGLKLADGSCKIFLNMTSEEWEDVGMDILDRGIMIGEERGLSKGQLKHLIQQVSRKKKKGLTSDQIAELFEENPDIISEIYALLDSFNAETQWREIISELNSQL